MKVRAAKEVALAVCRMARSLPGEVVFQDGRVSCLEVMSSFSAVEDDDMVWEEMTDKDTCLGGQRIMI